MIFKIRWIIQRTHFNVWRFQRIFGDSLQRENFVKKVCKRVFFQSIFLSISSGLEIYFKVDLSDAIETNVAKYDLINGTTSA